LSTGRLEAFSDGVIAIIITIMVLELRVPEDPSLDALTALAPVFLSYVLSFINVGIYWNNHHHLLQASKVVDGRVLWANLHLLFWLSLIPFGTAEMGENEFAALPVAVYGLILIGAGTAYYILSRALLAAQPDDAPLREAIRSDRKGIISVVIYAVSIALTLVAPGVSVALIVLVAAIWFVPDTRIARTLRS
jgi:uncharacterized membrane protein